MDTGRQFRQLALQLRQNGGNTNAGCSTMPMQLIEAVTEFLLPVTLAYELLALLKRFELVDHGHALQQKRPS